MHSSYSFVLVFVTHLFHALYYTVIYFVFGYFILGEVCTHK